MAYLDPPSPALLPNPEGLDRLVEIADLDVPVFTKEEIVQRRNVPVVQLRPLFQLMLERFSF